jgi:Flp pilus assembly protein TadD
MGRTKMKWLTVLLSLLVVCNAANAQTNRKAKKTALPDMRAQPQVSAQAAQNVGDMVDPPPQIRRSQLAAAIDPDVMRGYKALQANQFGQAREAYSQVLTRTPTQRDALLGIAYAHQALGSTEQALSTLRRLVELYPRDSDGMSALFLIAGGDPQAEESRLQQLLERSEHPAALHYTLGVLYYDLNRFGEAERAFGRACAMEPDQPDYAYNHALTLDRLGRTREAARQYVTALNLAGQTNAVFSRDIARARLRVLTATKPSLER